MRAEISIRNASDGDSAVLRSIYRRASLSNSGDREVLLKNAESLLWDDKLISSGGVRVLVDADGAIVGFATTAINGLACELVDLFVDPDSMRRGFGAHLVRDAIGVAGAAGCPNLEVTANPHAMAFYRYVGFTDGPAVETPFGIGTRMRLSVAGAID
jgi:GNAT superfamily N-acetyltransferase